MYKNIALRNPCSSLYTTCSARAAAVANIAGSNVGNILFSDSAYQLLSAPGVHVRALSYKVYGHNPNWVSRNFDAVVLPLANAFRLQWKEKLTRYAHFIERLRIPSIIMGVGIQTDIDYNFENLSPIDCAVKQLIAAVLDKSPSVGVRGFATKAYLMKLGFHDDYIDVIGCPSMYRNGSNLHINTTKLTQPNNLWKPTLNITDSGYDAIGFKIGKHEVIDVIRQNLKQFPLSTVLLQNNNSLITMLYGRILRKGTEYDALPHASRALLDNGRAISFIDPNRWISYLSRRDFVLGTRIHGNIAGLLAGTPSFVLVTDSRTRELCEFFHIPHARIDSLNGHRDAGYFAERASYAELLSNHGEAYKTFVNFLERNGLPYLHLRERGNRTANTKDIEHEPSYVAGVNRGVLLPYKYLFRRAQFKLRNLSKDIR